MVFPVLVLTVAGIAAAAVICSEGLTYLFVNSSNQYKRLTVDIDRSSKELERLRAGPSSASSKKREKALDIQLANATREYYMVKFKGMLISGVFYVSTFLYLGSAFKGKVVAKLPFVPILWFPSMTHRNLEGDDLTDCAHLFIYAMTLATLKINVSKLFGTEPSKAFAKETSVESMFNRFSKLTGNMAAAK